MLSLPLVACGGGGSGPAEDTADGAPDTASHDGSTSGGGDTTGAPGADAETDALGENATPADAAGQEDADADANADAGAGPVDAVSLPDAEPAPDALGQSDGAAWDAPAGSDAGAPAEADADEDASDEDASDEDTADTGPPPEPGPLLVTADGIWEAALDVIAEGDFTFAAAAGGGRVIAQDAEGETWLIDPSQPDTALTGTPGTVLSAVSLGEDDSALLVVAGSEGLFVEQDGELLESPLGDLVDGGPITQLATADDGWLWLTTPSGLWLFDGAELFEVTAGLQATDGPAIAWGPPVDDRPALWVAEADAVYALVEPADGGALEVGALRPELGGATAVAPDGDDRVWVAHEGDLHQREPEGLWRWLRLPDPAATVRAAASTGGLWIDQPDGPWFHSDHIYGPLDVAIAGDILGTDDLGRALVADGDTLTAVAVGDVPLPPPYVPPSWTDDIEPLSETHCGQCHGPGAFAHAMWSYDHWVDQIDLILLMVTTDQMPLPPNPLLDPTDIQLILEWEAAEYLP